MTWHKNGKRYNPDKMVHPSDGLEKVIDDLEKVAPVLLCKMEKIFPTRLLSLNAASDFAPASRGTNGGPVQARWCYPIERCLKVLRKKCRNKARIEASMAEAFILEEVSNFTTSYYKDSLPSVHNPIPRYNTDERSSNLSLFKGQLGRASASSTKTLRNDEWRTIMLYVLLNLDEVNPYVQ